MCRCCEAALVGFHSTPATGLPYVPHRDTRLDFKNKRQTLVSFGSSFSWLAGVYMFSFFSSGEQTNEAGLQFFCESDDTLARQFWPCGHKRNTFRPKNTRPPHQRACDTPRFTAGRQLAYLTQRANARIYTVHWSLVLCKVVCKRTRALMWEPEAS